MPTPVPDAERLYAALLAALRPRIAAQAALAGIATGGAWLAERLHADLGLDTPFGILSSALHRDDYATKGVGSMSNPTRLPFAVEGREIWLVDDVLHTGRTIRAALNELFDFGRPACVRLAVLVDRGGRELPVAADIAAATLALPHGQVLALRRDGAARFAFDLETRAA
jgi:pyrimidine operon attenuation protein/uracil phosphoribosyltransferase